jgi:hypothetical protein
MLALIFPSYEKTANKYFYLSRVGTMNSEENHWSDEGNVLVKEILNEG